MRLPLATLLTLAALAPLASAQNRPADHAPRFAGPPGPTDPAYAALAKQPTVAEIAAVMDRVLAYADQGTPARLLDRQTQREITDFSRPDPNAVFERNPQHSFQLVSYEWGVTYAAMLSAAQATGDERFRDFVARRFALIGHALPSFRAQPTNNFRNPLRGLIAPRALDDIGAMSAALIKARLAGVGPDLSPVIATAEQYLSHGQFRLADGTLARQWPVPDSVWADDMYMSVPALAQMGRLTGERGYYDDAVRQVLQISQRLFEPAKGIFRHGWISGNPDPIDIHWARANGWCMMAMSELLDVLPADHPGRAPVLALLRAQIRGVADLQSGSGLWHQLLDRPDSYLETSASAMFVYSMAHAIDRGWISPLYGSLAEAGWNAVAGQVDADGAVRGTCVGTNFALDLPYYYYRPTSTAAAHGYGPTLLAGAELIRMLQNPAIQAGSQVGSNYVMSKEEAAGVRR
ncbi:MAG TPA: glycoside hydrolase family 88 protein [Opitutaceae bacterium]|nr:glycoside hydrolase family 88 protein [Opitutaceae bacterium]